MNNPGQRDGADSPKEHFADEPILVHRLLVLAFWHLRPHL